MWGAVDLQSVIQAIIGLYDKPTENIKLQEFVTGKIIARGKCSEYT
jgi:hypothetical protein